VVPILGVCLGHQCIGEAFGARTVQAPSVVHGRASLLNHDGAGLFAGIDHPFWMGRYHSLVLDEQTLPHDLTVTARDESGVVMGVRHRHHQVEGIQGHPESVLTEHGHRLVANFLRDAVRSV
jgi:anthranilate synthase/aminodeoxychorismate synthase-like glutamine amidotransferase